MVERALELLTAVHGMPDLEKRRLLMAAVGHPEDGSWLLGDRFVDEETADRFRSLVAKRIAGEPLQYLEGTVEFGPIVIATDPRALIPRPETEGLWEIAAAAIPAGAVVVDLCTGSGNVALACKFARPDARVVATDTSSDAISLAVENAARLGLDVEFLVGDLFGPLPGSLAGSVDVVVANPPYVSTAEFEQLPAEIRNHEPFAALVGGSTGTEVLARIAGGAERWLVAGGMLACEIGETQGQSCLGLFGRYRPEIRQDLAGRDRYVVGRAPEGRNLD